MILLNDYETCKYRTTADQTQEKIFILYLNRIFKFLNRYEPGVESVIINVEILYQFFRRQKLLVLFRLNTYYYYISINCLQNHSTVSLNFKHYYYYLNF